MTYNCKFILPAFLVWSFFDCTGAVAASSKGSSDSICRIEVVEAGSRWPVALVQLTTSSQLRYVTDNAGVIAISDPDLMDRQVFFQVQGHGYEVPKDGFGFRGVRIIPKRGQTIRIEVKRTIIAKRLGRITGAGLFAHSQKLGELADWRESGVFGCDSVQTAAHRGKRFWLWGDTTLPRYPLGIFHMSGATTRLNPFDSLKPPIRIPFKYFREKQNRLRGVAKMPGKGPTWLSGLVSLPDREGDTHLVAHYLKVKPPLEGYEWGSAFGMNEDWSLIG